jgi:hypothetical protein
MTAPLIEKYLKPTPEIPDVFRRLPMEILRRYAQHGVTGPKDEMRRRRAEQEKPATAPKAVEPQTEKV